MKPAIRWGEGPGGAPGFTWGDGYWACVVSEPGASAAVVTVTDSRGKLLTRSAGVVALGQLVSAVFAHEVNDNRAKPTFVKGIDDTEGSIQ